MKGRRRRIRNAAGKEGKQKEQQEEKGKETQQKAPRHRGCEASCKGWSWRWVQKIYVPGKAIKKMTRNTGRQISWENNNFTKTVRKVSGKCKIMDDND